MSNFEYYSEPELVGINWKPNKPKINMKKIKKLIKPVYNNPRYPRSDYIRSGSSLTYVMWIQEQIYNEKLARAAKHKLKLKKMAEERANKIKAEQAAKDLSTAAYNNFLKQQAARQQGEASPDPENEETGAKGLGVAGIVGLLGVATAGFLIFS